MNFSLGFATALIFVGLLIILLASHELRRKEDAWSVWELGPYHGPAYPESLEEILARQYEKGEN